MTTRPSPEVIECLTRFGIASQLFQSFLETRLAPHGLTPAQLNVLSHIARARAPQRVTDIATAVQIGQPAATKILTKFEQAGWVVFIASSVDRRSKLAQITKAGGEHLINVQRSTMPDLGAFLTEWPTEDLHHLTQALTRLGQFLDDRRDLDLPD